jgi:kojibiose phosphorylase
VARRGTAKTSRAEAEEAEWLIVAEDFEPITERGVEAVFSVANGYFGVRAAIEEPNTASNPLLIVAGIYVPARGAARQTLLTLSDPARLDITVDGQHLEIAQVETIAHVRELDMRRALSKRTWVFADGEGRRWRWQSFRLASASHPDCYLYSLQLYPEEGEPARVLISFPTGVIVTHESAGQETELLGAEDVSAPHLLRGGSMVRAARTWVVDDSVAAAVRREEPLVISAVNRVVPVAAGGPQQDCVFDDVLAGHQRLWEERWKIADVPLVGDPRLRQAVRFAAYHLLSSAADVDGRFSIGPRDLSGRAYHGHIFWDTEIFVLPFLTFAWPEAARSCLLYRHHTLRAARNRAKESGYEGAMYAWESTDTGEDVTPPFAVLPSSKAVRILNGEQENHISADIPYAVVRYWRATGDDEFMRRYGAEILVECARFWRSRVSPEGGTYSIHNVIGPDEYHENVNNNAYTNAMARWTLLEAADCLERLQQPYGEDGRALAKRLGVKGDEPNEWREVADRIVRSTFYDDEVVPEFEGFLDLDEIDVECYRRAGIPLDIAVGHDAVQKMQAVKQPDVLMALLLLPHLWTEASARRNLDYYEAITTHTSSLSPPIHALLAAWLRNDELCRFYLEKSIDIDLGASFRGSAAGIHVGSLGGLWQAVVFGLGGLKFSHDALEIDPFLPSSVDSLGFSFFWQERRVQMRIADGRVRIGVEGEPCEVRVNRQRRLVSPEAPESFDFDPGLTYWAATREKDGN